MKTETILKTLKKGSAATNILLNILMGGIDYRALKRRAFYPTLPDFQRTRGGGDSFQKRKPNFYVILSQLRRQGFIKKEEKNGRSYWSITAAGRKKLEKGKEKYRLPGLVYKKEKDNGLNIVAFDIPEKEKRKRNWLRRVLLALDFTMLQKSVWAGKNKLPEDLLGDLRLLNLLDFIHIFRVSKPGTINKELRR